MPIGEEEEEERKRVRRNSKGTECKKAMSTRKRKSSKFILPPLKPQSKQPPLGVVQDPPFSPKFEFQNQSQSLRSDSRESKKKNVSNGKIFTPRKGRGKNQTYWKYLYYHLKEKTAPTTRNKMVEASMQGAWRGTREAYLQPTTLWKVSPLLFSGKTAVKESEKSPV